MTAEITVEPSETPQPADQEVDVEQQDFSVW